MSPRKYSHIERAMTTFERSSAASFIKDIQPVPFLFRKIERIVAAFFILTGLLHDVEPLKWQLREAGLDLMKESMSFREPGGGFGKEGTHDLLRGMAWALSLLEIGFITDLVSPMNFTILRRELEGVLGILEGRVRGGETPVSPVLIDERFFGTGGDEPLKKDAERFASPSKDEVRTHTGGLERHEPTPDAPMPGKSETVASGGHRGEDAVVKDTPKGHDSVKDIALYAAPAPASQPKPKKGPMERARKPPHPKGTIASLSRKKSISRFVTDKVREERKQIILTLLRKKGSAMVKDFLAVISGCREKTIQRQLLTLVNEGVLTRAGERRWSRYALAERKVTPLAEAQQG